MANVERTAKDTMNVVTESGSSNETPEIKRGSGALCKDIASESQVMACDYINFRLGREGYFWRECPELPCPNDIRLCMRSMGEEFEKLYCRQFSSMTDALNISPAIAFPTFHEVCEELFNDGITWGRIVALYAFGGTLAVQFLRKGMEELTSCTADWVAQYTQQQLSQWIAENGGWVCRIFYFAFFLNYFVFSFALFRIQ
ncbi:unnamed protein product [Soboliphyme baturini]|uniref:BCL domain-containing protein n=1 Tax=Soboliphyme baturini TaxID=241478 RepID=A0A183J297_9BILA|nr:unnamed protein product [Soboliphyme baturini]